MACTSRIRTSCSVERFRIPDADTKPPGRRTGTPRYSVRKTSTARRFGGSSPSAGRRRRRRQRPSSPRRNGGLRRLAAASPMVAAGICPGAAAGQTGLHRFTEGSRRFMPPMQPPNPDAAGATFRLRPGSRVPTLPTTSTGPASPGPVIWIGSIGDVSRTGTRPGPVPAVSGRLLDDRLSGRSMSPAHVRALPATAPTTVALHISGRRRADRLLCAEFVL